MNYTINPFTPNQPIDPKRFVGRQSEIRELESALFHTKSRQPRHFLLTGERGVGKTSFLNYVSETAKGKSKLSNIEFNFMVADIAIDSNFTRLELVAQIEKKLFSEVAQKKKSQEKLFQALEFLKRVEAFGVSIRPEQEKALNEKLLCEKLVDSIEVVANEVCTESPATAIKDDIFDGILIIIDEADLASKSLGLGSLIKNALESLARRGHYNVIFGLSGTPDVINVLLESHPSSLRIFDELVINNFNFPEVDLLLSQLELDSEHFGIKKLEFTQDAKESIWNLSGGHPHFFQQIGYHAFESAQSFIGHTDHIKIEKSHVLLGSFGERGAFDVIGDVYFNSAFDNNHNFEETILILKYIVSNRDYQFSIDEIISNVPTDIEALIELLDSWVKNRLIVRSPDRKNYKLKQAGFAYWFGNKYSEEMS